MIHDSYIDSFFFVVVALFVFASCPHFVLANWHHVISTSTYRASSSTMMSSMHMSRVDGPSVCHAHLHRACTNSTNKQIKEREIRKKEEKKRNATRRDESNSGLGGLNDVVQMGNQTPPDPSRWEVRSLAGQVASMHICCMCLWEVIVYVIYVESIRGIYFWLSIASAVHARART